MTNFCPVLLTFSGLDSYIVRSALQPSTFRARQRASGRRHQLGLSAAVDSPPETDTKLYDVLGVGKEASVADIKKASIGRGKKKTAGCGSMSLIFEAWIVWHGLASRWCCEARHVSSLTFCCVFYFPSILNGYVGRICKVWDSLLLSRSHGMLQEHNTDYVVICCTVYRIYMYVF